MRYSRFVEYTRSVHKKVFHVAYWDDIVKSNQLDSVEFATTKMDAVFTYDRRDASRYGMEYYPSFYSTVKYPTVPNKYDVVFVGNAKDRYDDIVHAYRTLTANGARCGFWIGAFEAGLGPTCEGIHYNEPLNYRQTMEIVQSSLTILDVTQRNATGPSLRLNEAFCQSKKLLSNNPNVVLEKQFDPRFMRVYNTSIAKSDIEFACNLSSVEYRVNTSIVSPTRFLEYLEERLLG